MDSRLKLELEQATREFNDEAIRIRKVYLDKMGEIKSKCNHRYDSGNPATVQIYIRGRSGNSCCICGCELDDEDMVKLSKQ